MSRQTLLNGIKNQFYILEWLPDYRKEDFAADLKSGITVGVIEVPQVMAYAVIAGLSPIYGLYGSLIPLLIYPLFGTSRHLALGVVATDMIIIASGASMIAAPGSEKYVSVVLLLTMLTGLVHIGFSLFRMGFLVNLLSRPVIYGFMAAAPLIIGFSQLGNILGVELERSQYIVVLITDAIDHYQSVNLYALAIGVFGLLFLITLKRFNPLFPRAIVLLGVGGVMMWLISPVEAGIKTIGEIPSGLPSFSLHEISLEDARRLIPTISTLVLVQLMSVMSLGKMFASKHKYPISPNREFFALGMANFIGSFFQSPPVSGSFSRSAVSEQSGSRSALSNVVCACLIGLTLLFFTPLFYYIPISALAAIILVAALSLINLKELRYFFRTKPEDAYIALFTFVSVLFIGIQEGILLGIGASLFVVLYRSSRPNLAVLGHIKGTHFFRDIERHTTATQIEEILILRFDSSITFNNAEYIKDFIIYESEKRNQQIRALVIEARSIHSLDTTAMEVLQSIVETLEEWKIDVHFSGLTSPVKDVLLRSGLARELGGTHFHIGTHQAIVYLLNKWDRMDRQRKSDEDSPNAEPDRSSPHETTEQDLQIDEPNRLKTYLKRVE